ncbi:MAG: DUF547 domain-containing protein [Armatimonadetes bacterium]|nr:DUF547 domain-containing protein [Armatimonadota bacterium]
MYILFGAAIVAGSSALVAARATRRDRSVLNNGEPVASIPAGELAAELIRTARRLKVHFYDGERRALDYAAAGRSDELAHLVQTACALRVMDLSSLDSRARKLAFWINLYNALTVHAIVAFKPAHSVWDTKGFFDRAAYNVGGYQFSLNDIENGVLRANRPGPYSLRRPFSARDPRRRFALAEAEFDPRIHFALNCGSRSCPPIAFYDPEEIDRQLDLAARAFVQGETQVRDGRIITSPIFNWYRGDFGGDVRGFLGRYLDPAVARQLAGKRVGFSRYDWSLNR